ncbi:glycosyltransferase [Sphingobacterium sp. E70]|nr:glycosyltransferase [Sphingobacterium sp. E70]ULT24158.1 glycosyltransferase [Sphingobacterium sp. E70]
MQHVIPALHGNFKLLMVGPFDQRPTLKERLLNLLPAKLYHLSTLFLGHPTDQQEMRRLLKAYPEKIQHLGKVPFAQLKHLLANAKAFLMPNIHVPGDMEGFGLVCLEASSAGAVVVASELKESRAQLHITTTVFCSTLRIRMPGSGNCNPFWIIPTIIKILDSNLRTIPMLILAGISWPEAIVIPSSGSAKNRNQTINLALSQMKNPFVVMFYWFKEYQLRYDAC